MLDTSTFVLLNDYSAAVDVVVVQEAIAVAQEYQQALPEGRMSLLVDSYISALCAEGEVEEVHLLGWCCSCVVHTHKHTHTLPSQAAAQCKRLLGEDSAAWERWIGRFFDECGDVGKSAIGAAAPSSSVRLSPATYERMMLHYMVSEPSRFLLCVRQWSGMPDGVIIQTGKARTASFISDDGSILTDVPTELPGNNPSSGTVPLAALGQSVTPVIRPVASPLYNTAALTTELKVCVSVCVCARAPCGLVCCALQCAYWKECVFERASRQLSSWSIEFLS